MRIVLVSPNKYSYYSLSVCESLLNAGIKIDSVFYLKFSLKRILLNLIKHPKKTFEKFVKNNSLNEY